MSNEREDTSPNAFYVHAALIILSAVFATLGASDYSTIEDKEKALRELTHVAQLESRQLENHLQAFSRTNDVNEASKHFNEAAELTSSFVFVDESLFLKRFALLRAWFAGIQSYDESERSQLWLTRNAHWPVRLTMRSFRSRGTALWGIDTEWLDTKEVQNREQDSVSYLTTSQDLAESKNAWSKSPKCLMAWIGGLVLAAYCAWMLAGLGHDD